MAYGMEFYNAAGNLFIGLGEKNYQYWGVKHIDHTFVSPSEPDKTVALFNLPSNEKVMVLVNTDQAVATASGYAHGDLVSGKWVGRVRGGSASGRFSFYVFVPVHLVPIPDWGVSIFNDNGKAVFHSARPPMRLLDIHDVTLASGTSHTHAVRVASIPSIAGIQATGGPSFYHINCCTGKTLGRVSWGPAGYTQAIYYRNSKVGVVDADFLDQFANLGNHPL